jgi:hypothetical protein
MTRKAKNGFAENPTDAVRLFASADHVRTIELPSGRILYMACKGSSGDEVDSEFDDVAMVRNAINGATALLSPFRNAALAGERVRNSVRAIRDLLPDTLQPGDLDDTLVELGLLAASRRLNWAAFAALLED